MNDTAVIRFIPSRIEGASPVDEVAIFPDQLELHRAEERTIVRFVDIARWPSPHLFWKLAFSLGLKPHWLPIADRDWFHLPAERFFRFYTDPPLVVFMPQDERPGPYVDTYFFRIQRTMGAGGFHTFDLG